MGPQQSACIVLPLSRLGDALLQAQHSATQQEMAAHCGLPAAFVQSAQSGMYLGILCRTWAGLPAKSVLCGCELKSFRMSSGLLFIASSCAQHKRMLS